MNSEPENLPQDTPEQTLPPAGPKYKRQHRQPDHAASCSVFAVLFIIAFFISQMTAGISFPLLLPLLITALLLVPGANKLHQKTGKFKWLLRFFRTAACLMLILLFAFPFICTHFTHTPAMFRLKRWIYTKGVREPQLTRLLMPETLPQHCEDYFFRTEPSMIAQDYCPFAYLAFHTDEAFLHSYEWNLEHNLNLERLENPRYTKEDAEAHSYSDEALNAGYLPMFVYGYVTELGGISDDLTNAVIYQGNNSGAWHVGSGALINYETGLLIVWL